MSSPCFNGKLNTRKHAIAPQGKKNIFFFIRPRNRKPFPLHRHRHLQAKELGIICFKFLSLFKFLQHTVPSCWLFAPPDISESENKKCSAVFWLGGKFHLCGNRAQKFHLCLYHSELQRLSNKMYHDFQDSAHLVPYTPQTSLALEFIDLANVALRWLHTILFYQGSMDHKHAAWVCKHLIGAQGRILQSIYSQHVHSFRLVNPIFCKNKEKQDILNYMIEKLLGTESGTYIFFQNPEVFSPNFAHCDEDNVILPSCLIIRPLFDFLASCSFLPSWEQVAAVAKLHKKRKAKLGRVPLTHPTVGFWWLLPPPPF